MLSQSKSISTNRVQAIRSKFENLSCDSTNSQLNKHTAQSYDNNSNTDKENINNDGFNEERLDYAESSNSNCSVKPNTSYLHQSNLKKSSIDLKKSLSRQSSDPGKKLHRRHAFRCDRSKVMGPKRHGSCNGRSETSDFAIKPEKKLNKDRLEKLCNVIDNQMRKENLLNKEHIAGQIVDVTEGNQTFVFSNKVGNNVDDAIDITQNSNPLNSIPDSEVPAHILEQYAKVIKPRPVDEKKDGMIDSGVSSETENLDDDKSSKIKQIIGQFEKPDGTNLDAMNDLCASSETIRLERKNPHLVLTSTLKKALKQPLPPGPPPKKPPRVFSSSPTSELPKKQKKDTRKKLEKLEQVLLKREGKKSITNNYDIAEENESLCVEEKSVQPKEMHYLCTEILDITNKTLPLPPNPLNCFKSLNCAITNNSTLSLPYTEIKARRQSSRLCSCSNDNLAPYPDRLSTFLDHKCVKCQLNGQKDTEFKCHLKCRCNGELSQFFIQKENIYDEPFASEYGVTLRRSHYGTLNHSKSLEDLRSKEIEDQKIYDIPCEISRPASPEYSELLNLEDASNERMENVIIATKSHEPSTLTLDLQNPQVAISSDSEAKMSPLNHLKSIFENNETLKQQDSNPKKEIDLKLNFEQLRKNFESDVASTNLKNFRNDKFKREVLNSSKEENVDSSKVSLTKPPMKPKPMFLKKNSRSTENLIETKRYTEKGIKFSTDQIKCRTERDGKPGRLSLPERDAQLDQDKDNLNRLMNELYETVVACSMQPAPPFPLSSTSEESVKLSRSLTEKRKNYVRRVSSRVAYADTKSPRKQRHQTSICVYAPEGGGDSVNKYNTFRSWKSFRTSQSNIARMEGDLTDSNTDFDTDKSIDEKAGCVDVAPPLPRERGLFSLCLLAALDRVTGTGHIRFGFPKQVKIPEHITNLMFPETLSDDIDPAAAQSSHSQCYCMVLTDERGERSYGYCRRVVPEGASVCLPLCYCIITRFRAPGFYYKVLEEIESHHGSSDVEINSILQQLFDTDFPKPGQEIVVTYNQPENSWRLSKDYENSVQNSIGNSQNRLSNDYENSLQNSIQNSRNLNSQNSVNVRRNSENFDKCKTLPNMRRSDTSDISDSDYKSDSLHFYDLENNNGARIVLNIDGPKTKYIKMPLDPRVDESSLSTLVDTLGVGLTVKVFGSLLLERKVIICGDDLGRVSQCMTAVQLMLYPLVWQQPLISLVPRELRAGVLGAPLPLLAGVLCGMTPVPQDIEGMLIDLTHPSKVICCQGDESTILPTNSYRTLKTALQMEYKKDSEDKTRNVMISEAFLRFFVEIFGDFWKYFSLGEVKEGQFGNTGVIFDTENFIKNAPSKQNQYFFEWFTETAIFNHFIQNMSVLYRKSSDTDRQSIDDVKLDLIDAPLPDFYNLFEDRVRNRTKIDADKFDKSNYKNALNKRMKLLKARLKELVA